MAGLLDFLQTPEAQMGVGLLAAGGPSTVPMNVGQRVQMALQGVNADKAQQMKLKLLESQMAENESQNQLRASQMQMAQQKQAGLSNFFGGAPASGGSIAAPAGGGASPGSLQLKGMPVETVAQLKAMYGVDLMDQWKAANVPTQFSAGSYAYTPGQSAEFLPDPSKGIGFSGGQITMLPGAQNLATLQGQQAGATARAQANWQEATPVINDQGQKVIKSRAELLGGSPPAGNYRTEADMKSTAQGDMGMNPAGLARELVALKRDLEKVPDVASKRMIQEQIDTLMGQAQKYNVPIVSAGNVVELSPQQQADNDADKARKVDTAKADVVRDTGKTAEGKRAGQVAQISGLAAQLLDQGPTASGVGSLVDTAANFVGQPLKGGTKAQQLEALSGWLVSNVPRMEGPQSNADVLNYQTMAGRVGDRTLPVEARKAALGTLMELQRKYSESGTETTSPTPSKPAKVLESLPTPNSSNKGQRIRDTTTGKVLISNGLQWKEE